MVCIFSDGCSEFGDIGEVINIYRVYLVYPYLRLRSSETYYFEDEIIEDKSHLLTSKNDTVDYTVENMPLSQNRYLTLEY